MYSVSKAVAMMLLGAAAAAWAAQSSGATLRVCADPNNLPFSNEQQQGFENKIASLIARDMNLPVEYFWLPQRSQFFNKTLHRGVCDVVIGVPTNMQELATTQPYYRSSYVFVSRKDSKLDIESLDDPRLRSLRIGVHILGEQDESQPPVHALISRGIVKNLVGYSIFGNLTETDPGADVIKAVEQGNVDIAVVWGPLAGYFAQQSRVPLVITPVEDDRLNPQLPFYFDIGIGVRAHDTALRNKLNAELTRRRTDIEQILRRYGIPQLALSQQAARATEER